VPNWAFEVRLRQEGAGERGGGFFPPPSGLEKELRIRTFWHEGLCIDHGAVGIPPKNPFAIPLEINLKGKKQNSGMKVIANKDIRFMQC